MKIRLSYLAFLLFLQQIYVSCSKDKLQSEIKPNIIWLVAEDQSPMFFPMYGDSTVKLPNLSSLEKDGILYTNAYTPAPVCAPARSALITGLYPTTMGTHNMRTFNPYKKENEPSIGIPNYSPLVPIGVKMFPEYLRAEGYYTTNSSKEDYNFKKTDGAWNDSSTSAHWRNRSSNQPFFSVFNFGITHESQIWEQANKELLVDPELVPIPPVFPKTNEIKNDIAINYSNLIRLDEKIGELIDELKSEGLYKNSVIFFFSDHGGPFPRYKRAIYETGIRVPLIVKLPNSKNAGTINNDFISFIDFAPTILSIAKIKPPEVMQGKAKLGIYKENKNEPFVFAASDRFDEKTDRLRAVRYKNFKYIRNFNPNISNAISVSYREQMPMMQNLNQLWKDQKMEKNVSRWFITPKPIEELYNLDKDPYELNNLANKIKQKEILKFLRYILNKWIYETKDLGEFSEKELLFNWFQNNNYSELDSLNIKILEGKIFLDHSDPGASILWKKPKDSIWEIYVKPIKISKPIQAKAVRIGYNDSPVSEIN